MCASSWLLFLIFRGSRQRDGIQKSVYMGSMQSSNLQDRSGFRGISDLLLIVLIPAYVFCLLLLCGREQKSCLHVIQLELQEDFFMRKERKWPENCVWPEPIWDGEGDFWDEDLAEMSELDEDGEELLDIKAYMDELVEEGRLNPDYSLNEDYEEDEDTEAMESFTPETGIDYWDDGFDLQTWEEDLSRHMNLLKIGICDPDPITFIRQLTGYTFINENIARQAFTRRSFGMAYGVGDSETLEFYGDTVLNTVVSRELYRRFSDINTCAVDAPFWSKHPEGELSKIRQKFVSQDHLAARASRLGLDHFILYGPGEEPGDAAREDMMEALIGAVAVDSDWDWRLLEDVVDRLINLQLENADDLVKKTAYEQFNTWHQKHFGSMPEYTVDRNMRTHGKELYDCILRFNAPENDKGIRTAQRIVALDAPTRSAGREYAAREAIAFLQNNGLWINLAGAGIKPDIENAINQLQELYQKKYTEKPEYQFEERKIIGAEWYCRCTCSGIEGWGMASAKVKAKKKAAHMVLTRLLRTGDGPVS